MRLFHFLTWIRRLRDRLANRKARKARRVPPRSPEQTPEKFSPLLTILEQRESFVDVSLLGIVTSAGASGAAGFLFGAAALMMREP